MPLRSFTIQTPQQLGPLLKALRRQRGLTQADLAQRLGITRQAVGALERRPEAATFERLMKVWALLDVEVGLTPRTSVTTPVAEDW
jgi:HTH-type transcriptional regulator/antitoxin HipB